MSLSIAFRVLSFAHSVDYARAKRDSFDEFKRARGAQLLYVLFSFLLRFEDKGAEFAFCSAARVYDVGVVLFAEDKVDDDLEERFFHR